MSIARSCHNPDEKLWLWELLNKLNKIRNSFAHTLENETLEKEINEFVRITALRLEKENITCPKDNTNLKMILVHFCGAVYSEFLK